MPHGFVFLLFNKIKPIWQVANCDILHRQKLFGLPIFIMPEQIKLFELLHHNMTDSCTNIRMQHQTAKNNCKRSNGNNRYAPGNHGAHTDPACLGLVQPIKLFLCLFRQRISFVQRFIRRQFVQIRLIRIIDSLSEHDLKQFVAQWFTHSDPPPPILYAAFVARVLIVH